MVIRGVVLMVVGGALLSCERSPAAPVGSPRPAEPPLPVEWTTRSSSGNATVTGGRAGTVCRVVCERGGAPVWERHECLAKPADHRFVSDDCATFVYLQDAPFVEPVLSHTRVGATYGVAGRPVVLRLGRLAKTTGTKLSASGRWVAWLAGTVEHPGEPPRDLADGSGLGFETLDGEHHSLSFAELARWVDAPPPKEELAAPAPGAAPPGGDAGPAGDPHPGLYQWVDEDDVIQVTAWAQVPPKRRAKATALSADISVVGSPPKQPGVVVLWSPPEPQGANRCALAQQQVDRIESELRRVPVSSVHNCGGYLATREMIAYQRCISANDGAEKSREAQLLEIGRRLEAAREELRRVQVGGCR